MSDFATPWTIADQVSPSMGLSRQDYWSGLPFRSPGDLPDPVIEPGSPTLQADTLPSEPLVKPMLDLKDNQIFVELLDINHTGYTFFRVF